MNSPKVSPSDYIQFLIASPRAVSGTEAARVHPEKEAGPSHGIYDKGRDGKTKNDHLRDLLATAYTRGFEPECVLFDS